MNHIPAWLEFDLWRILRCPLCHSPFQHLEGSGLVCEGGHCFDVARKGYINFAPTHRAYNYDKTFFESRCLLFAAGIYAHIVEAIALRFENITAAHGVLRVCDAGCGEGSFLRALAETVPGAAWFGADIEKHAVAIAARFVRGGMLVADIANLPLQSDSMDVVLNLFAPAKYDEFSRVLVKDGLLIKAIPGPEHMREVRMLAGLQQKENDAVSALFEKRFQLIERIRCCRECEIPSELRPHIANMTPLLFHRQLSDEQVASLQKLTVDAELLIGKANNYQ